MASFPFFRIRPRGLGTLVFALLTAAGTSLFGQTNTPSATDGFNPNVTGTVNAVLVQPNGQIIVGGLFTSLQPNGATSPTTRGNLARLNADGSVDPTFDPEPNGQVLTMVLLSNGQILIGGYFSTVQPNGATSTTTRNHIARLNSDGSLDTTFDPNVQGRFSSQLNTAEINAIAVQANGQILLGGTFVALQPNGAASATTINNLARVNSDGSLDTTFNPDPNQQVDTICVEPSGQILIGGAFATVQPNGASATTAAPYLARLSSAGLLDTTFNPTPSGQVSVICMQADGEILVGGRFITMQPNGAAATTNVDNIARLNPDGSLDTTFTTNAGGAINAMTLQSDGRILIGGTIGTISNGGDSTFTISYLARLNRDGTPDETFIPAPNYVVYAIAVQANGSIVVGGNFTQLQPNGAASATNRNSLARINPDGTLDVDFIADAFGGIGTITPMSNGQVLVGGVFTSINGVTCSNLARLNANGTVDSTFTASVTGSVTAIALQANGQIIIGGNFTNVDNTSINYLARLNANGTLDSTFNPVPDGAVYVLVVQPNGQILVGGAFTGFDPNNAATETLLSYLARLNSDGSIDFNFQPNPSGVVYAILLEPSDNAVIIGGAFGAVTPVDQDNDTATTTTTPNIARLDMTDGLCDITFLPNPNGTVYTLALQPQNGSNPEQIILGGNFTTLQPNPSSQTVVVDGVDTTVILPAASTRQYLARINADGSLDQNFAPVGNGQVLSLALNPTNGQIVAGGVFTNISNISRNYIVRLNSAGAVDTGFSASLNGPVDAVQYLSNNQFLIGGSFTTVLQAGASTPTPVTHLARFNGDGSLDTTFLPAFNTGSSISTLAVQPDNKIIIGGSFTNVAGVYAANIARFNADTSQDASFYANANAPVNAIVVEAGGTFLVGGSFTAIGAGSASNLARLNVDSTLDTTFTAFPDGPVNAIVGQTNLPIVIGGTFAHVGGVAVANLARISSAGVVDTTFTPNPNATVDAIAEQTNGQYLVGGTFTQIGAVASNYLARINANGSLDTTFAPLVNGVVKAILIQPDGKILIGGSFTSVEGTGRNNIARLNSDGSLDTAFNPGANGAVNTMVLQAPAPGAATSQGGASVDQILVGGAFTSIDATTVNYLARLNYDGSLDTTFEPGPDGAITALAVQIDGKPVLAGAFSNVGGQPRNGLARLADSVGSTQSITVSSDFNTLTWTLAGGPEITSAVFEVSTDDATWTTLGFGTRVGVTDAWQLAGVANSLPDGTNFYIQVVGISPTAQGGSTSCLGDVQQFNTYALPVIYSSATTSTVANGPFYYEIAAAHVPTSYSATGLPAGLSINTSTGAISGTPTQTGVYSVTITATNVAGTATGTLTITAAASSAGAAVAPLSRLIALSARSSVTAGNPLITGLAISGSGPKTVLLLAVGPGLTALDTPGLTSATVLAQPKLQLYNSLGQVLLTNQGWDGSSVLMQIMNEFGAEPALVVGSADDAVVTSLVPGNYTIVVSDGSVAGLGGIVLAEVYDADSNSLSLTQRLVALSGRANVSAVSPLIGGFAIEGSVSKKVLVQAVGPGLTGSGALVAPVLSIYSGSTLIAQNTGWGTQVTVNSSYPAPTPAAITSAETITGASPLASGSADSAFIITLPPGAYTGVISGAGGQTGTALFEVYEIPTP